jgi:L-2-amino-thiazoline-4-carboxylic acid hydrolase
MSDVAWTGTPVRPHPGARDNGAESLPWGGRRERLPLAWPFADAVQGYRDKALANPEFDPAATFVWGQMMAVGLIEALKSVEETFGAEGHDVMRSALRRVGDRIVSEMTQDAEPPEDATPAEIASLVASWINEVCYASIEAPRVKDEAADFDIHYCPHEDVYGAFDCRVQRYYVEGMIDAARRHFGSMFDVRFTSTIPAGSHTCHFDMFPKEGAGDEWNEYSDQLRGKALRVVDVTNNGPPG